MSDARDEPVTRRILVTGGAGFLGKAVVRRLRECGYHKIAAPRSWEYDLVRWDISKPNGQPRRRLDTTRARERFGFQPNTDFRTGLKHTVGWYLGHQGSSTRSVA